MNNKNQLYILDQVLVNVTDKKIRLHVVQEVFRAGVCFSFTVICSGDI